MKTNIIKIAAAAFILAACTKTAEEKPSEKMMPGPGMMNAMETVALVKSNPKILFKVAGELRPDQHTELFAKVNSYVRSIHTDIGSKVVKGQVLVVLEAPEIQSQVASLKAKFEAQQAIYFSTKSTYDRIMKANDTHGAIAKDALDQIRSRKLSDEAQLKAAKSAYNEMKDVGNYLTIKAPFSGTVISRSVDQGAYVGPGAKQPLLVVENNAKLRLQLSVPEASTPYISEGDTLRFYVRSQPQKKYMALVSRKSGSLDERLRSEKIEADYINTGNALKPHMIAETSILLHGSEPTFFVPKSAVVESAGGMYIIAVENGKTKNISISKGRMNGELLEIFGDLAAGQKILKMASEEMQEGTLVPAGKKAM